ncbi:acetylornithine aminotransferase [Weizmannia acidilactici]|uniref:Acetylornithine aminotransferase n=1 Tax=Weizmannia acidilactici TaxID=2607726 RepID=A0A5J4J1X2_9BACI|nr:acetylornithine transaminase [Weizmannia acidilactici]GER67709.1 acetylornithine aminotransferase [Weizmannia acidilactici]GER68946.1 acetylornithine aminotransferase [Weizmannia acidilactici]GER73872.1 acetylornithine aminotransferase [Weizmannia acidilactici]
MVKQSAIKVKHALMETYRRTPVKLIKGKGCFAWDENGKKYLDFTSGIAVCNLGHVPEKVKEKVGKQLDQIWHTSNLFEIEAQEKLAEKLTELSTFDRAFFSNSGAEANEAAIKLARLYANKRKKSGPIVTFQHSFHGRTLGTLSATGQEKIQKGFDPLLPGFAYLPYNDPAALSEVDTIKPIAVMLELVQGEGGVIPAKQVWVDALISTCKKNGILVIVDEVQTGMGRTGTLFAYEQYGFEPDIMTLAKGLGSGFPIGAMLAKEEVAESFTPGTHGSTFGGNPLATTAGLATLETFIEEKVIENAQKQSKYLWAKLETFKAQFSFIKDVRGKGLMVGIETEIEAAEIIRAALKEDLLVLSAGPHVVRLLPPLIVSEEEIDLFAEKMQTVFSHF